MYCRTCTRQTPTASSVLITPFSLPLSSYFFPHPTMTQNNQGSRRKYWATYFSVHSFACPLAPLTHSLALHCLLRSCAPLRSFTRLLARLLTQSHALGKVDVWMLGDQAVWTIVNPEPLFRWRISNLFHPQPYSPQPPPGSIYMHLSPVLDLVNFSFFGAFSRTRVVCILLQVIRFVCFLAFLFTFLLFSRLGLNYSCRSLIAPSFQ